MDAGRWALVCGEALQLESQSGCTWLHPLQASRPGPSADAELSRASSLWRRQGPGLGPCHLPPFPVAPLTFLYNLWPIKSK